MTSHLRMNPLKKSQSHVTTEGKLASLFWCHAPIWDLRPEFYFRQTDAGLLMWGTLSDERTGVFYNVQCIRSYLHGRLYSLALKLKRVCWMFVDMEKRSVPSRSPGIHLRGNVCLFRIHCCGNVPIEPLSSNGRLCSASLAVYFRVFTRHVTIWKYRTHVSSVRYLRGAPTPFRATASL
jgi:hypothetical protein